MLLKAGGFNHYYPVGFKDETMTTQPKKIGRPTKYTPDMPQKMLDFFQRPLERDVIEEVPTKDGVVTIVRKNLIGYQVSRGFVLNT
jgi:hypothetical protein